ncbi:MAG TPA: hypothetical protein VL286_02055 [Rhizomicrobium sp.]|nr:hypothetical protein [Rhizomicrobium sp.]
MWHLLALPFVLFGFLVSGAMAAAGVTLVAIFTIPLIVLALVFRVGFFFLKFAMVALLGVLLLVAFV